MAGYPFPRQLTALMAAGLTACGVIAGCSGSSSSPASSLSPSSSPGAVEEVSGGPSGSYLVPAGIHKIKHVIIVMQENRSFDSYFGTYPGADGIPAKNGQFTVCVPDPRTHGCDRPYHDPSLVNGGAGHNLQDTATDIDHGKMDGFVASAEGTTPDTEKAGCAANAEPPVNGPEPVGDQCLDVMGYHTAAEIPNYWTYAHDFVLQDHMFEPAQAWSLVA
ncbi:MAG TPA: alkaline phosphatase family protein, partial [Streptosporangiaceae bacterium]|nr:alkaline phosphatase family protein [Streptosporangiaceae bacterium]